MKTLKSMRRQKFAFAISLVLIALITACQTVGDSDSVSVNCNLEAPPAGAGEMAGEGGQMRVYPRSTEMPRHYSGCQTVWGLSKRENVWLFMLQRHYSNGALIELRAIDKGPVDKVCKYKKGSLVDSPKSCPRFENANKPEASLPPGCLEAVAHSMRAEIEPCFQQYK